MDPALSFLLQQAPTAALALVGLWMFVTGRLHSDREMEEAVKRAEAERDRVLGDLKTERAAHDNTRAALTTASARADAGVRATELIAYAIEGRRVQTQAPQIPSAPAP